MMLNQRALSPGRERLIVLVSFVIAFLLALVPVPAAVSPFRPDWVALCLVYWATTEPEMVGLGTGWVTGIVLDALYGTVLGGVALANTVLAFLTVKTHLRLRMFPRWQQAVAVFVLIGIDHLIILLIRHGTGSPAGNWSYWVSDLTGAILWPVVYELLQYLRQASVFS